MTTFDPFHYYRDHADSGAWGVRHASRGNIVAVGLDKPVAAAVALLLNGDTASAMSLLETLPSTMPAAPDPDPDTSPNPWRETVRDIYDFIHLHTDIAHNVAFTMNIIAIIEERHPRYFGIANLEPPARP